MSMVFPKWMNHFPTASALGGGGAFIAAVGLITYYFTPKWWEVGYEPIQPVEYSHQIHVGLLGMDCLYCHTGVEESAHANIPDAATCMNCHEADVTVDAAGARSVSGGYLAQSLLEKHKDNPNLIALRDHWESGEAVEWRRVHKLPDYVQFNHAAHLNAGISCYSCHGRVDQQPVVRQVENLSMAWCLECHRNPEASLIDKSRIDLTDLAAVEEQLRMDDQIEMGRRVAESKVLEPSTNCGLCHY